MTDLATLQNQLTALQGIRAGGAQRLRFSDGKEVAYRTDAELAAAISDLERRIAATQGQSINRVRFNTSKGF
jgi:hypothetical protein